MNKEHIGYVVAILSVIASGVISWYFYDKSQQHRVPTYSVDPIPSPVFRANKEKDFPFKVITNDGKPILKSIYSATHYFWNNGDKPILKSDVLDDLVIKLSAEELDILSVSIGKSSRDVVKCKTTRIGEDQIKLTYNVLERGDGCAVNILYTGSREPEHEITGTIIGVDKFVLHNETIDDYFDNLPWYDPYKRFLPGLAILIPFIIVLVLFLKARDTGKRRFWADAVVYALFVSQIYILLEIKVGSNSYFISNEMPNVSSWVPKTTANKPIKQD